MDAKNLATQYDLPPMEWPRIANRLAAGVDQAPGTDGPGRGTRKGRNLARDARCSLSVATDDFDLTVNGAEFSAPSAGPPPWFVYRLQPSRATALLTVPPGGATSWRF
jgi:hypothetical protein